MKAFIESISALGLLTLTKMVLGAPNPVHTNLEARATDAKHTDPCYSEFLHGLSDDTVIYNNVATTEAGKQCLKSYEMSEGSTNWKVWWDFPNGKGTSALAYANVKTTPKKQLSSINSIPTTWDWSYSNTSAIVADVAYDLFLSNHESGGDWNKDVAFEVMVWLSTMGGAVPLSYDYKKGAIRNVTIGGTEWALWQGKPPGRDWTTYTFQAHSDINNYSGDLMDFMNHLMEKQGVHDTLWLTSIGSGTEPFKGQGTLTTTKYTCSVN